MSVHRRGERWTVRYRDGAAHRQRTFASYDDAVLFDASTTVRRATGTLDELAAGKQTLDAYVAETWAPTYDAMLAPATRGLYARLYDVVIGPTLGAVALRNITPEMVSAWQAAEVRRGRGREQIRQAHTLLGNILQRAVESRRIATNPQRLSRKVKPGPRRRPVVLAPASVEALRAALRRTGSLTPDRDATLVSVLAYAGLRPGEALTLRWRDIGARTITVDAPKTGQRRIVRLLAPLKADLAAWRMASGRPAPSALVFPARNGAWTPAAYRSWTRRAFRDAATAAGIDGVTVYDLRHSFASLLAHERRSAPYIADQLGHGVELSLKTYQHVLRELEDQPAIAADDAIRGARANGGANIRAV